MSSNWLRDEFERAKRRNALLPAHARPVVCGPGLTTRRTRPVAKANPHARATCTWGCCPPPPCAIVDADVDTRGRE